MKMTKEEAIAILQEEYDYCKSGYDLQADPEEECLDRWRRCWTGNLS